MSTHGSAFPAAEGPRQETVGDTFADYLALVDETIRTQVTDDDIRARIRYAMDQAASGWGGRRDQSRTQPGIPGQRSENIQPGQAGDRVSGEDTGPDRRKDQARELPSRGSGELRSRRMLLDELIALTRDPSQGPAVLAGPGGTGKTTLAGALARHARAQGDRVWWVSAADPVTLSRDLKEVAQQLGTAGDVEAIAQGSADAADRLWRLLGNAGSGWLLVFDEADDPRVLTAAGSAAGVQDLTGWVRSSERGLALVTSRETDQRMWQAARLLAIGALKEADAARVLLELAPSAGNEDQARVLARRLGGHPLSLRLAGSYLHSRVAQGASFVAYERALGEDAQADTDPSGRGRRGAVAAEVLTARALKLSLDGLAQQGIPQTRRVLQLASCYAPATIPASLLNARALTVTGLLADPGGNSPAAHGKAEEALRELADTGILKTAQGGVALHTAITEAGRASLDGLDPLSARIRHAAIELLYASTSQLPTEHPDSWPQYLLLGPHLLTLLETATRWIDQEHLGLLLESTARTAEAFNLGEASQAGSVLCERALARSTALGNEHRAVLRVRHTIAWAMAIRGDTSAAEALYRDNLRTQLRVLGPADQDVLSSRHELAWIAACRQDWAAAEKGYRAALGDRLRILDPDDPLIMLTRHELAWAIANQGKDRLGEARDIFRTVLADRRRVLGPEHLRTLTTMHEIAWVDARQGRWERAETSYRKVLLLRQRILGEDHRDTLVVRHELAWIAACRGRTAEAESRYSDVLNQRRRILGDDHPQTLTTQEALDELRRGRIIDARHIA